MKRPRCETRVHAEDGDKRKRQADKKMEEARKMREKPWRCRRDGGRALRACLHDAIRRASCGKMRQSETSVSLMYLSLHCLRMTGKRPSARESVREDSVRVLLAARATTLAGALEISQPADDPHTCVLSCQATVLSRAVIPFVGSSCAKI